jgi:hypothetical protein
MFSRKIQPTLCLACTVLLLAFQPYNSTGQNAPVTTATTVANAQPGIVTIPLTVTGFTFVGAISLSIDYDYSVMTFVQGIKNPLLPGNFAIADNDPGNGFHRVSMGWFGTGMDLPDGSSIMDLQFSYISGITPLTWYENGGSCEYANGNYMPMNDIPTADYYINGYVCGPLGEPGPVAGNDTVCAGQAGEIYTIAPVVNATGYTWSVPEGVSIITGQNTNSITVDFTLAAVSGDIAVYASNPCGTGPSAFLSVTVNELPVANAGSDVSIPYGTSTTLYAASGGAGSFTYHWSPEEYLVDPDVQNPQTVNLTTTTIFTLLVTNLGSLCQNSDEVVVTITGGPLNANPLAIPSTICLGGSSQLYSNAGGGSGNYTYEWTCNPPGSPPWSSTLPNPIVTPDTTTHYLVEVYDGFNNTIGTTVVTVFPEPTATISGGDTLCGTGALTMLPVDLTGTPPWSFTYSFGNTSVYVNNLLSTPYYIIASESGDYTITAVDDAHCSGTSYGIAQVRKFPIPPTPEIDQNQNELMSSSCCGNQWYLNDTAIPGATDQYYTATVSGLYHVIVTLNGCSSAPSEIIDIIVGINEFSTEAMNFSIHPNPVTNEATMNYTVQSEGFITLEIASMLGQTIEIMVEEVQMAGDYHVNFDTSELQPGVYAATLRFRSNSGWHKSFLKIVKAQ